VDTKPPGRNAGPEIAARVAEAALGSVPVVGNALAVTFVTALGWRLEQRREQWFTQLAEGVEELRQRVDDRLDLAALTGDNRFTDAVVSATRTIEHTHQAEKIQALRNAVLNSALPSAPDTDTQAMFLNMVDRFTPSHLRMVTFWSDESAWFASHGIPEPQWNTKSTWTGAMEVGLPEMQGRSDFYLILGSELQAAGLLKNFNLNTGPGPSLGRKFEFDGGLTTDFGKRFVRFISPPWNA
jgi:hypothetical protein